MITSNEQENFLLYGGEVELIYNDKAHSYFVSEGAGPSFRVPSVTGIVSILDKSGPLIGWAVKAANNVWRGAIQANQSYPEIHLQAIERAALNAHKEIKQEAADIGTIAHEQISTLLSEGSHEWVLRDGQSEAVTNCVRAAESWLKEHEVVIEGLYLERPLYNRDLKYSGRSDLAYAYVDGEPSIVDWKSSKGLFPEHRLQLAGYNLAWTCEFPDKPIVSHWLVRLGKSDGAFEAHKFTGEQIELDKQGFLAAHQLYRWNLVASHKPRKTNKSSKRKSKQRTKRGRKRTTPV